MKDEGEFLKPLFSQLGKRKISYGVLRNFNSLPESLEGSDLDILISKRDISDFYKIFYNVLRLTNGCEISKSKGIVPKICILGGGINKYYGIQLDIHHGIIPYKVFNIFSTDLLLSRIQKHNNVNVVDEDDAVFVAFLQKIFYNGHCEKYFLASKKAWIKNKEIYQKELTTKFSNHFIKLLDKIFSENNYQSLKVQELGDIGIKNLTSGLLKKGKIINSFLKKTYRFNKPLGYSIAFLGVDGSGKTTIIDKLTPILTEAVHNEIYYEHMRPNLLPSIASLLGEEEVVGIITNPHEKPASGFLGSLFRITYYSLDYIFGYWFRIYPSIVRKPSLWIFDRYFYDYLIDPKRGRINLPKWIAKVFNFFIPTPDLIICLGGNSEIIYERKKEVSLKEVQKQVDILKSFAERQNNAFWIDTTESIDSTIDSVIELIKNNMNKRID